MDTLTFYFCSLLVLFVNSPRVLSPTHTQPHATTHANKHAHTNHVHQVNGQASNTVLISYTPPEISRLLCSACTTAGGNLTLQGTDFGSSAVAGTNASVRVGGSDCAVLTPFDHFTVRCALPAGQGTLSVTITISGQVLLTVMRGEWSGWN